jgi:DNA-binding transcriptional ArsR family regulator
MSHDHKPDLAQLDASTARAVAEMMAALSTPSRVRILSRLSAGPCAVNELADGVEMEQSAVSQQLRVLRHLGLVVGERRGRQVIYALHDDHVGELLEQAVSHAEHLRFGWRTVHEPPMQPGTAPPGQRRRHPVSVDAAA